MLQLLRALFVPSSWYKSGLGQLVLTGQTKGENQRAYFKKPLILGDAELRVLGDMPIVTSLASWVCVLVPTCMTTHTQAHMKSQCVSGLWNSLERLPLRRPGSTLNDLGFLESL